jgi:hypothetical protein
LASERPWNGGDIKAVEEALVGFVLGRSGRSHDERFDDWN